MYILTQDQKKIVNTTNVTSIELVTDEKKITIKAYGNTVFNSAYGCVDCSGDILGTYRLKENAQKVIQHIFCEMTDGMATFTMPLEEEV